MWKLVLLGKKWYATQIRSVYGDEESIQFRC